MVVTTKRLLQEGLLSNTALTFMQALSVTVLTAIAIALLPGQSFALPTASEFWWCAAFLSLVCTIMAFFVQNHAVRKTTPTRVNLLMGTEPLWGFVCAVVFLGEPATIGSVAGAIMVLAGSGVAIYTLTRQGRVIEAEGPVGNP